MGCRTRPRYHSYLVLSYLSGGESLLVCVNADCLGLRLLPRHVDASDMTEPDGIEGRGRYPGRETRLVAASLRNLEGEGVSFRVVARHRGRALAVWQPRWYQSWSVCVGCSSTKILENERHHRKRGVDWLGKYDCRRSPPDIGRGTCGQLSGCRGPLNCGQSFGAESVEYGHNNRFWHCEKRYY